MSQEEDLKQCIRPSTLEPGCFRQMARVNNISASIRPFQFSLFLLLYVWLTLLSPHFGPTFEWIPLAEARPSDSNLRATLVTQEFLYRSPDAGEVWLVWGVNGWQQAPDIFRPPGTIVKDNTLHTPLVRTGKTFAATLRVLPGTAVDYGFLVTKTEKNIPLKLWEGGRPFPKAKIDTLIDFESTASPVTADQRQAWLSGQAMDLPLVTHEFHYHLPGAGEVWLVWGVNGWNNLPKPFRPSGTEVKDKLMRTPLVRKGDDFATTVRLPPGMAIEYAFLITKTEAGVAVDVWEDAGELPTSIMRTAGQIEIGSKLNLVRIEQREAWLAGQVADLPLVTQEIRYRAPGAAEVWLLWGLDDWQAIPTTIRPPGTVLEQGIMKTFMARDGDVFSTTVRVPPGAVLHYKFVIAKTDGSSFIGQSDSNRAGVVIARLDGRVDVESAVTKASMEQRKTWPLGHLSDLSLVAQELQYRLAGAEEVWLVWGINGWQTIPEAARPPGTVLKDNKVMQSRMVRKGDTFATTVRVPPGTMLNYGFLITKTSRGTPVSIWQDNAGQAFWKLVKAGGTQEEKATVAVVTPEQRKAWLSGQIADLPLVTQTIRYHAPAAAEVWLIWGLDGWQTIPEAARPSGTVLNNGRMQTHLVREGNTFTTTVRLPPGTRFDYEFLIAKTEEGSTVDIRQEKDVHGQAFSRVVAFDDRIEVQSTAWLSIGATDLPLVAQEIRYRIAGAEEVWLVWGINGWQAIPEEARPPGTMLKNNKLMQSRMVRKGDTFATTIQVPKGTKLDYKFLITKTSRGVPVSIWQDHNGQDFGKLVRVSGSLEEKATVTVVTPEQRKAWLSGQIADLPLVTQTIRYHAPGAAEVWFEWGLEGWHPIPEAARPIGTALKDGRMHTAMVRKGSTFTTTIQVPPGTVLNFLFRMTRTDEGTTLDIRHENDEEGRILSRLLAFDGQIDIYSQWKRRP